jgi:hypothetical protein
MSHFTVLVVQQDGKTLDEMMAPFHQFECTELEQFIEDIDITEEAKKEYMTRTNRVFVSPDGHSELSAYEPQFYRDPTKEELKEIGPIAGMGWGHGKHWDSRDWGDGKGYRTKIHHLPEGWTEKEVPKTEDETFLEFIEGWYGSGKKPVKFDEEPDISGKHKFGYTMLDADGNVLKVVRRTNPNDKWDWFSVGGRWSGMYELKPGASGALGSRSLLDRGPDDRPANSADAMLKGDIDWDGMRVRREAEIRKNWQLVHELIDGLEEPLIGWSDMLNAAFLAAGLDGTSGKWTEEHDKVRDEVRERYWKQEGIRVLQDAGKRNRDLESILHFSLDKYVGKDIEALVKKERAQVGLTHALLIDGVWYEAGEMGWWGAGSDQKEKVEWHEKFWELLNKVPDDTPVFLVDCHI